MYNSELSSFSKKSLSRNDKLKSSGLKEDALLAKLTATLSHVTNGSSLRSSFVDPTIAKLLEAEAEVGGDFRSMREVKDDHKKAIDKIIFLPAVIAGGRRVEEAVHGLNLVGCIDSAINLCGDNFFQIFHKDLDIAGFANSYVRHLTEEIQELKSVKSAIASELPVPSEADVRIDMIGDHDDRLTEMFAQMHARFESRVKFEALVRVKNKFRASRSSRLEGGEDEKADIDDDLSATLPMTEPSFGSSPEADRYRQMEAEANEDFERAVRSKFAARCREYKNQKGESGARKERQSELTHRQDKAKLVQLLANGYVDNMNAIALHVRNAVMNYPEMIIKLKYQVIINASGRVVTDPFSQQAPCIRAMYQTLCTEYRKANLVTTCHMLMNMFTRKPPAGGVTTAVSQINEDLHVWDQMDLMQYMNKDKLFTIALIKDLPPDSEIRADGVRRVIEYARQLEDNGFVSNDDEMPLYRHLTSWITNVYMRSKSLISVSSQSGGEKSQQRTKETRSGESAAAATVAYQGKTGSDSTPSASPPPPPSQPKKMIVENEQFPMTFPSEVRRDRNLWFSAKDRTGAIVERPYTATRADCAGCLANKGGAHSPMCFTRKTCFKCSMYGHSASHCHQRNAASSTATANSAAEGVTDAA